MHQNNNPMISLKSRINPKKYLRTNLQKNPQRNPQRNLQRNLQKNPKNNPGINAWRNPQKNQKKPHLKYLQNRLSKNLLLKRTLMHGQNTIVIIQMLLWLLAISLRRSLKKYSSLSSLKSCKASPCLISICTILCLYTITKVDNID